jgi:hypothetical protein
VDKELNVLKIKGKHCHPPPSKKIKRELEIAQVRKESIEHEDDTYRRIYNRVQPTTISPRTAARAMKAERKKAQPPAPKTLDSLDIILRDPRYSSYSLDLDSRPFYRGFHGGAPVFFFEAQLEAARESGSINLLGDGTMKSRPRIPPGISQIYFIHWETNGRVRIIHFKELQVKCYS